MRSQAALACRVWLAPCAGVRAARARCPIGGGDESCNDGLLFDAVILPAGKALNIRLQASTGFRCSMLRWRVTHVLPLLSGPRRAFLNGSNRWTELLLRLQLANCDDRGSQPQQQASATLRTPTPSCELTPAQPADVICGTHCQRRRIHMQSSSCLHPATPLKLCRQRTRH